MLIGPGGSLKRSLVHAAARELNFKVVHINASTIRRSGANVKRLVTETTQSEHISLPSLSASASFSEKLAALPFETEEAKQPSRAQSNARLPVVESLAVPVPKKAQSKKSKRPIKIACGSALPRADRRN